MASETKISSNESSEFMGKDLQIKMLKEQLDFTQKQLEEKDRQLEHYKGLVKTFQELLQEVSGLGRANSSRNILTQEAPSTHEAPSLPRTNSIKGRKSYSFHVDDRDLSSHRVESFDDSNLHEDNLKGGKSHPSRLRRSQTSLSILGEKEDIVPSSSRSKLLERSGSVSSAIPSKSNNNKTLPTTASNKQIQRSVSMTSVYNALEENRFDLKFPELDHMVGQIYGLSKYQQGCRFLQKKLEERNAEYTKMIFNELFEHLIELMTDPFGNYLFSRLIEHCDEQQKESLLNKILPDLLPIAFDMYGTQSMQKMLPFLTPVQVEKIIQQFKPSSIALIKHNKANYLVQYFLDNLEPQQNQWIHDGVADSLEEVARDRVGCVIVKKCIDSATEAQREKLIAATVKKALILVQDPFGNYVVQHLLDKFPGSECARLLIRELLGHLSELCVQKFSSNVVEKCLQVADKDTCKLMLEEIINSESLPQFLNDRFANFVIQTALDVAQPEQHADIVKKILPLLGRHFSPYTKRLQKKILQLS